MAEATELIQSDEPRPYELSSKRPVTHDTKVFRFELPEGARLDYAPGDHVVITIDVDGEKVSRPYSPCLPPWTEGYFELPIKRYENGCVSKRLHDEVNVGDEVMIAGPYEGGHYVQGVTKKVGLVAGGTGITPMLSIMRTILQRGDPVGVWLLFANKTEDDIICRQEFDLYAQQDNFSRYYALETPPNGWSGGVGRGNETMLIERLPKPSERTVIFLSGPAPMVQTLEPLLHKIGHDKERVILP